jgi:phosphoglycolate phosphatase-like HAD superfamily hydrolase
MDGRMSTISVLITDIDNTLFDWFAFWFTSFKAMLDKIKEISGLPEDLLVREIKQIHERYGTSEYSLLVEKLPSLLDKHPDGDLTEIYGPAIEEYRKERASSLVLYPGVYATLQEIKKTGCMIVAFTESKEFYTNYRIRKLGLDGLVDFVYYPKDHEVPDNIDSIRKYPPSHYQLKRTRQRYIPDNKQKPDPSILRGIVEDIKADNDRTVYVGDSLVKDIYMAQQAKIIDVYARYGKSHNRMGYDLLRAVTHWTPEMVEKEKRIDENNIVPGFILKSQFSELLDIFSFKG